MENNEIKCGSTGIELELEARDYRKQLIEGKLDTGAGLILANLLGKQLASVKLRHSIQMRMNIEPTKDLKDFATK